MLDNIAQIKHEFKSVELIVDDGDKKGGIPSTIVKVEEDGSVSIVRQGAVKVS